MTAYFAILFSLWGVARLILLSPVYLPYITRGEEDFNTLKALCHIHLHINTIAGVNSLKFFCDFTKYFVKAMSGLRASGKEALSRLNTMPYDDFR